MTKTTSVGVDQNVGVDQLESEKECSHCGEVKLINQERQFLNGFYQRSDSPDGFRHQCKDCYKAQRYELEVAKRGNNIYRPRHEDSVGVSPDLVPEITLTGVIRDSKVCSVCNERKPFEEFHKHQRGKFGRHSTCKLCRLEDAYQKRN